MNPSAKIAPASSAQRRLWFLDHFTSGNSAYNLVSALRLHGPLDTAALHSSLRDLVARHETLRTTFRAEGGEPYQHIAPALDLPLPITDLTSLPAPQRAARAGAIVESEALREFDLAEGPLIRTGLLRLDEGDHVLSVICHHSIFDGWSMGRLCEELSVLYAAHLAGTAPELPPLPLQFGDHAAQEEAARAGSGYRDSLAHWLERLAGAPSVLELPTPYTRPAVQGFEGACHDLRLDRETWQAVQRTARAHRVTPFMTLLAVYALLLSRLSGTEDVVIGSPSAGRTSASVQPLIGMFVNTLPLRVDLSGDPEFTALLHRVRRTALDAFTHQHVPLEQIVTELRLDRATSHDPLFQAMFALQQPAPLPQLAGLEVGFLPTRPPKTFSDLWLEVVPHGEGAVCTFRYRTELFDAATIERLAGQYRTLLVGALDAPESRISRLPLLTPEEADRILRQWSRSAEPYPWDGPVHELILRQAERTPEAEAVVFGDTRLSYAELAGRAGRISRQLTEDAPVVALCLPRGVELLPSILAVLSSGRAYLPLSPEDPPGRLARLLRSSGAGQVLTTAELSAAFTGTGVPVLAVDTLEKDDAPGEPPAPAPVSPEDLAYVIYTSGSTGEPKAVGVPHRGLANRIHCLRDSQDLTAADRVLHKTPYTFDVSVWELLGPLTVGAALVVAEPGGHRDPAYLVGLIEQEAVTTVHFVPPMLEVFLDQPDLERCRSLRRVLCSGQALPVQLRDRTLARLPVRLYNLYGPTEASIEVTEWQCLPVQAGPDGPREARVPIGRPLAGVEVYVLDAELRPVPVGLPGELYLGGVALARGYLGRPDLTADRFVPHPYSTTPGARLYRTGDLVRWRSDGAVDFLGRNDHQLKVRGFRIEPGEIEHLLREQPGVLDAVVTTAASGTQHALTAYLVRSGPAADDEAFTAGLRERLRDLLPRYMVPAFLVVLPAFPLNASGKVDRAALPAPAGGAAQQRVAPQDGIEETLAAIWSQVLGGREIGVTEDFFEIGGDSLQSVQVVHRARAAGLSLTVGQIFHHPNVRELAAQLRRDEGGVR